MDKQAVLTIRVTPAEHEQIKHAAWSRKMSINKYATAVLMSDHAMLAAHPVRRTEHATQAGGTDPTAP